MPTHYDDKTKVPGTRAKKLQPKPAGRPEIDGSKMLQAVLDVPELKTMEEPERPEFDRRRAKHLNYAAAASLLGAGLGAAFDMPLATNLFGGLSEGYSGAAGAMQDDYTKQLGAYQERLFETQKTNTGITNKGAEMQQAADVKAVELRHSFDTLAETQAHNEATESHQGARVDQGHDRNEESRRHNEAMEEVARRNAETQAVRAAAYEKHGAGKDPLALTGHVLASQQIDSYINQLRTEMTALTSDPTQAIVQKDRVKEIQRQIGDLTKQKFQIMAGLNERGLQELGEDAPAQEGSGAGRGFILPGGPLDTFIRQSSGQAPKQGPVPSEGGAGAPAKSKYGLEDLF